MQTGLQVKVLAGEAQIVVDGAEDRVHGGIAEGGVPGTPGDVAAFVAEALRGAEVVIVVVVAAERVPGTG